MVVVSMPIRILYLLFCNYFGLYGHCGLFGLCRTYYVGCDVRCGCRTDTTQDVYVPSAGRGGLGSSSQVATGDRDEDEDDDDVD